MGEAFETAAAFARQLIDGRGKDTAWTKRARTFAAAVYQVAQAEGKNGEACEARAFELLRAPEAVLLERMGRSIAISVSMQAKMLTRLSAQQRASILAALSTGARTRLEKTSRCSHEPGGRVAARERGVVAAVGSANLAGQRILVVEEQALIALDLRVALEEAGAEVQLARNAPEALAHLGQREFTAAVLDVRPGSDDHKTVARALKQRGVRFVFYATHPPEDVTTVRGAPVFQKPGRPEDIVKALALLVGLGS